MITLSATQISTSLFRRLCRLFVLLIRIVVTGTLALLFHWSKEYSRKDKLPNYVDYTQVGWAVEINTIMFVACSTVCSRTLQKPGTRTVTAVDRWRREDKDKEFLIFSFRRWPWQWWIVLKEEKKLKLLEWKITCKNTNYRVKFGGGFIMLIGKGCRAKVRWYLLYPCAYANPPSPRPTSSSHPGAPPCQRCSMVSLVPQNVLVNGNCLYLLYACLFWAEMIKMLKETKIRLHSA